ncbi:MAG: hypothetical protein B6U85_00130 [Desulfurococcales archaeon ex4484_42]|nr:MAG: hypothetical protein B6U85_00130 [Desulfurococcales archaeon ex4484_42]
MNRNLDRVKRETRILFVTSRDVGQVKLTLFAIIRGIMGIEHIMLKLLSKEEAIKLLSKDPLLSEVRFIIDMDDPSSSNEVLKMLGDHRIKYVMENTIHILNVIMEELVNLITSHN